MSDDPTPIRLSQRVAIDDAGRLLALARAERDSLLPDLAARAAWQSGGPSVQEIENRIRAQRGLPPLTLDEYIRSVVDQAPPFSAETKSRLYVLLAPVREGLARRNAGGKGQPNREAPPASPARVADPLAPPSPWLSVAETATRTKHHPKTVLKALRKYQHTNGREGLKGGQPNGPRSRWRVHLTDADRWNAGEAPAQGRGRKSRT
jgi:hypothetical protein